MKSPGLGRFEIEIDPSVNRSFRSEVDTLAMIHQTQHQTFMQTRAVAHPPARRRQLATGEDVLAVLLLPLNLVIAIGAMVYWIVAAVIQGHDEG